MPVNPKADCNVLLYLNPLSGRQMSGENFNQLVSIDTYQRLVKQDEQNAMSGPAATSANASDHFQPYYSYLGPNEHKELAVSGILRCFCFQQSPDSQG